MICNISVSRKLLCGREYSYIVHILQDLQLFRKVQKIIK